MLGLRRQISYLTRAGHKCEVPTVLGNDGFLG
jgi:hypothetical protein